MVKPRVDPAIVYDILQHHLDDFEEFIDYIYSYLELEGYLNGDTKSTDQEDPKHV